MGLQYKNFDGWDRMANLGESNQVRPTLLLIGCEYEKWVAELEKQGVNILNCYTLEEADGIIRNKIGNRCAVVIVEFGLYSFSLSSLRRLTLSRPNLRWISLLDGSSIRHASMREFLFNNCVDYYTKPVPVERLVGSVNHQFGIQALCPVRQSVDAEQCWGMVGGSVVIEQLKTQIAATSMTNDVVLLSGDDALLKLHVAREIHRKSDQRNGEFAHLWYDGSSRYDISESATSEIESGSDFPDEQGNHLTATLYVSHLENVSLKALFCWIHHIRTSKNSVYSHSRLIVGTEAREAHQAFVSATREMQLSSEQLIELTMPNFNQRLDDIPQLTHTLVRAISKEAAIPCPDVATEVIDALVHKSWPGEMQEFYNVVKRAVFFCQNSRLTLKDLALPTQHHERMTLREAKEQAERQVLVRTLGETRGDVSQASEILDVSQATLYRLLLKHGIAQRR